jgi:hypothetical protein
METVLYILSLPKLYSGDHQQQSSVRIMQLPESWGSKIDHESRGIRKQEWLCWLGEQQFIRQTDSPVSLEADVSCRTIRVVTP